MQAAGRKRSLRLLASGALISDPQRRGGAKGPFTTATIRATGDEPVLVSVIAFGADGERLFQYSKGDALAVSGRARLTNWTARDGTEKHGASIVVDQIAAAKLKPQRRAASPARRVTQRRLSSPTSAPLHNDRLDDLWPDTGGAVGRRL